MKKPYLKFFLALFFIVGSASSLQKKLIDCEPYPYSRVAFKHREHKGVGWDKGYSTLSLFLAPRNNHVLVPFLDARFHAFNNGYIASNLGAGTRFAPISDNFVIGLNAYYDFREYKSFSSHQASGGVEILTSIFDLRVNGYYPFSGKTEEKDLYFHRFQKNSAYLRQDILYSLPSADAEIGFELPEPMKQVQLYLAFGSYYLFKTEASNHAIGNVIGYKARMTATPEDYISFGVEYTHDRLFNNRVNGYVSFQVPLGKKKAKTKSKHKYYKHRKECDSYYTGMRRKTQDPYHNEIIPFYDETHTFNADRTAPNPYRFIFVNNTNLDPDQIGSGSGTFEDPYTTLKLGELNSIPGDIIYVYYGRGNDDGYNKGFVFKSRQMLTSSSLNLDAKGFIIPASTPFNPPKVSNHFLPSSSTILAANCLDIVLQGFNLSSSNTNTIFYSNSSGQIQNNTITALNSDAIHLENSSITLQNNTITAPAGKLSLFHEKLKDSILQFNIFNEGIKITGNDQQANLYKINNNKFNITSNDAINLENPAISLLINHNEFYSTNSTNTAINYQKNQSSLSNANIITTYKNNSIVKGFQNGINHEFLTKENESTSFLQNNISSTTEKGIIVKSSSQNGNCSISENSILSGTCALAFYPLQGSDVTCLVDRNTFLINGNAFSNIFVETVSKGNLSITNNKIENTAGIGILISNKNSSSQLYSYEIIQNTIKAGFAEGIEIVNAQNSKGSTYGSILNNQIGSTDVINKVFFSVENNALGNICSSVNNNSGINVGLEAQTSTTAGGQIVIKSATGNIQNDNPGFNNVITNGQVSITTLSASCPRYIPVIYVDNTNSKPNPDGSKENPFPTLKQAEASSAIGKVIYVLPGDGTTKGYNQGIILKDSQTIGSPAVTFEADGIIFEGDGSPEPKITSSSGAVIAAANGCAIRGLNIIPNIDVDGITTTNSNNLVEITNNTILTSGSGKAIVLDSPKALISQNTLTMNDSSQGIVHSSLLPFTQTVNLTIENNSFISTKTGYPEEFAYLNLDLSSSAVDSQVSFNQNIASQTKKNFILLSSSTSNNFALSNNSYDGSDNGLLIDFKGGGVLSLQKNTIIAPPTSQQKVGSVNIANENPLVVTPLLNNTFISKDGSNVAGVYFLIANNLCLADVGLNTTQSPENYSCSFIFSKDPSSPTTPTLNIAESQDVLNQFNPGLTFDFESPITPSFNTPCP
jgi:hypothetical protein